MWILVRPYSFLKLILSRLEYGSALCVGANNLYLDRLQKLVNRSLRICLHESRDANVVRMHLNVKILPLKIRRNIALMKLMFGRIISKKFDIQAETHKVGTRGNKYVKLNIPFPKTEFFRKSLTYQGPARWLALPNHMTDNSMDKPWQNNSMEEFSKSLKEWYVHEFVHSGTI